MRYGPYLKNLLEYINGSGVRKLGDTPIKKLSCMTVSTVISPIGTVGDGSFYVGTTVHEVGKIIEGSGKGIAKVPETLLKESFPCL